MVRINTGPRKKNAPRAAWRVEESYLQWLRGRPCFLESKGGCGAVSNFRKPVEPAHVDCAGGKGMGLKVADCYAIPLCQKHHDEQHGKVGSFKDRGGWKTFQAKYGFDAVQVAAGYWRQWKSDKGELA